MPSSASSQESQTVPPAQRESLFRDRNFRLLWLAQIISSLGDWALLIAIPVTVYDGTGSRVALSLSLVAETLPGMLLGLFAGVVADRMSRRTLMVLSDLGRMVTVLLLLNVHNLHHLNDRDRWFIYGMAFLTTAFGSFFSPARSALMAALLPRERLMQANALSSSSIRLTQFVGPALAGVLLRFLHPRGIFVFDAATFVVSAVCVIFVVESSVRRVAPKGLAGVWQDFLEGSRAFWAESILGVLIGLLFIASFAGGIFNALLYAFSKDVLKAGGAGFGYLLSAFGLGAVVAVPLVAGPFKDTPPPRLIAWGFAVLTLGSLALVSSPDYRLGAVALFVFGLGNILVLLPVTTMFQTAAPPQLAGRVIGTAVTLGSFFTASSALAAAGLVSVYPHLRVIFGCLTFAYALCGLLAQPLLNRRRPPAEA